MARGDCADCGGFDVEWMRRCSKHKGVELCRGCECPYCAEEAYDDYDVDDDGLVQQRESQP